MSTKINEAELKLELARVYKKFLANPTDSSFHKSAMKIHEKYMNLVGHGFVPDKIENSISNLTEIIQYGKGTQDDKDLVKYSKEILPILEED